MLLEALFFTSTMASAFWTDNCPEPSVCTCKDTIFNCTCDSRQNITVTPIYNYQIRHVLIKGCGTVLIPLGSLFHLHLESIELDDLDRLNIHPFALAGLQDTEILKISNIQDMDVESRGFSGLYNISTVIISNVYWKNMLAESFGAVSSTENFIVRDSKFETVESLAFIFQNVTKFSVQNSHFGTVENMSLLVHGSREVSFENCTIQRTSYTALSMSFVEMLSFQMCSFDLLATSAIFAKNVGSFVLNNSSVNELETDAFKNVEVLKEIRFTNNVVIQAKKDSLYLNRNSSDSKKTTEIVISGNKLACDCNLAWLCENQMKVYKDFIESSYCIGSSNKVSSVSPRICSKPECSGLNGTSLSPEGNEKEYTPYETNKTFSEINQTLTESKVVHRVSSTTGKQYSDCLFVAFCFAGFLWKSF